MSQGRRAPCRLTPRQRDVAALEVWPRPQGMRFLRLGKSRAFRQAGTLAASKCGRWWTRGPPEERLEMVKKRK